MKVNKVDLELAGIALCIVFVLTIMGFAAHYEWSKYRAARIIIEGCKQ